MDPYLTGPAEVVLKTLPPQDLNNYDQDKVVILDCYELTPEMQRQRFWVLRYKVGDRQKTLITPPSSGVHYPLVSPGYTRGMKHR